MTVPDEGRLGIEPVRHLATGTVTRVLLAHFFLRFGEKESDADEVGDMAMARTTSSLDETLAGQT